MSDRAPVGACRTLGEQGFDVLAATRQDIDWTEQSAAVAYFEKHNPDVAILAAAKVGGIHANNTYPADFIADNLAIQNHFIGSAIFLGSSCIYPKLAKQPIVESELLNGPLEPTNDAYAVAKIAGIKTCEAFNRQHGTDYRSLMPTNLYGPGDNFHPENSHVIPALMRRIHEAKDKDLDEVVIWGTGSPRREFLHVDDLARAVAHIVQIDRQAYWGVVPERESHINVGTGVDITIRELAETLKKVVGFEGSLRFDSDKPDGTPRKVLNVQRLESLGFCASTEFEAGLVDTYQWFLANQHSMRG